MLWIKPIIVYLILLQFHWSEGFHKEVCEIHQPDYAEAVLEDLSRCLQLVGSGYVFIHRNSETFDRLNFQENTRSYVWPLGILAVKNTRDVTNSILCTKHLKLHIAIKSGGHSYEKYSFGDNSTLIVDLGRLNSVSISPKSVTAGAGLILSQLYNTVWNAAKVGVVGGLCPNVGSGLTLGGGLGYFARRYGMASDNVIEMEMVDANGNVLKASSLENSDLFWALRGAGGGNFGIVTKIKYRTFNVARVTFKNVFMTYRSSDFGPVFKSWLSWLAANLEGSTFSQLVISSQKLVLNFMDQDMKSSEIDSLRRMFPPVTVNMSVLTQNFMQLVTYPGDPLALAVDLPTVGYFAAKSYYSSKFNLAHTELQKFASVLGRIPKGVGLLFSAYGGAINMIPTDATAFVHRTSIYKIELGIAEKNGQVDKWVQDFDSFATSTIDNGESYQNNIDGTLKDYLNRYYGKNVPTLVQIKTKYDPENIFRFPQSIPTLFSYW